MWILRRNAAGKIAYHKYHLKCSSLTLVLDAHLDENVFHTNKDTSWADITLKTAHCMHDKNTSKDIMPVYKLWGTNTY